MPTLQQKLVSTRWNALPSGILLSGKNALYR